MNVNFLSEMENYISLLRSIHFSISCQVLVVTSTGITLVPLWFLCFEQISLQNALP